MTHVRRLSMDGTKQLRSFLSMIPIKETTSFASSLTLRFSLTHPHSGTLGNHVWQYNWHAYWHTHTHIRLSFNLSTRPPQTRNNPVMRRRTHAKSADEDIKKLGKLQQFCVPTRRSQLFSLSLKRARRSRNSLSTFSDVDAQSRSHVCSSTFFS